MDTVSFQVAGERFLALVKQPIRQGRIYTADMPDKYIAAVVIDQLEKG